MKYTGRVFPIDELPIELIGEDIKRHLAGCNRVLLCAATLGEDFDRSLRKLQLESMSEAVIADRKAGIALEEFCDGKDYELLKGYKKYTKRFCPGYGDLPLSVNRDIANILNVSVRIGLCVTDSLVLIPQKSIIGIVGIQ